MSLGNYGAKPHTPKRRRVCQGLRPRHPQEGRNVGERSPPQTPPLSGRKMFGALPLKPHPDNRARRHDCTFLRNTHHVKEIYSPPLTPRGQDTVSVPAVGRHRSCPQNAPANPYHCGWQVHQHQRQRRPWHQSPTS